MPLPQLQGVPFGSARHTSYYSSYLACLFKEKHSFFSIQYKVKHPDFHKEKSNHLGFAKGDNKHTKTIQCNTYEKFKIIRGSLGE